MSFVELLHEVYYTDLGPSGTDFHQGWMESPHILSEARHSGRAVTLYDAERNANEEWIYVIGGARCSYVGSNVIDVYHVTNDTWSSYGGLNLGRISPMVMLTKVVTPRHSTANDHDMRIWVFGGHTAFDEAKSRTDSVEVSELLTVPSNTS